jgi:predicted RNase H-like nuclease (RuvC/YqgF family)
MTDKELIAFLRDLPFLRAAAAADRIEQLVATNEALTEQLEAARADAKEAEAYAEELEAMNKNQEAMIRQADRRGDALEAKLAKAVRGLNAICVWGEDTYARDMARTTLAEIENSEAVTLGEKT